MDSLLHTNDKCYIHFLHEFYTSMHGFACTYMWAVIVDNDNVLQGIFFPRS